MGIEEGEKEEECGFDRRLYFEMFMYIKNRGVDMHIYSIRASLSLRPPRKLTI